MSQLPSTPPTPCYSIPWVCFPTLLGSRWFWIFFTKITKQCHLILLPLFFLPLCSFCFFFTFLRLLFSMALFPALCLMAGTLQMAPAKGGRACVVMIVRRFSPALLYQSLSDPLRPVVMSSHLLIPQKGTQPVCSEMTLLPKKVAATPSRWGCKWNCGPTTRQKRKVGIIVFQVLGPDWLSCTLKLKQTIF